MRRALIWSTLLRVMPNWLATSIGGCGFLGVVVRYLKVLHPLLCLFLQLLLDRGTGRLAADGVQGLVLHDAHEVVVEVSVFVRHVPVARQALHECDERLLDHVVGLDRGEVRLQEGAHGTFVLVVEFRPAYARRVAGEGFEKAHGCFRDCGHGDSIPQVWRKW